ncbi:MAG: hypothetical protein WBA91_11900 [Paracoccaceae bacterium]
MPDHILPGSIGAFLIFAAIWAIPPYFTLRLFVRTYRRAERRGVTPGRYLIALALMIICYLFNIGVLLRFGLALSDGTADLGGTEAIAFGISWVSFWLWIFLRLAIGRDLGRKSGLR